MFFYYLTHVFILIRLFIYFFIKLFLINEIALKGLLVIFLIICIIFLYKYPRTRFKKLSQLRNYKVNLIYKYAMKTKKKKIYNKIILLISFFLSVIVIFTFRFANKDNNINLIDFYNVLVNTIIKVSFFEISLNIIILSLFFVFYILFLKKVFKYFKLHIIKYHIYLVGNIFTADKNNWYQLVFFHQFLYKINIYKLHFYFIEYLRDIYEKYYYKEKQKPINFEIFSKEEQEAFYWKKPVEPFLFLTKYKEDVILLHIITKGHYYVLLMLLLYDICYNNFQINHVFYWLPWIFIFDLYIKLCTFIDGLWLPHDEIIHTIIYAHKIELWDDNTLLIDDHFFDYKKIKEIYKHYILRGFVKDSRYL